MFTSVLIANRGAIATRIIRTLKKMRIRSVAVYHDADFESLHVRKADHAVALGGGTAKDTYLNIDKIIAAAKASGAQAIHPGYGFLSENLEFVKRCEQEGIVFIGPRSDQIDLFGLKHRARESAQKAGVPLVPGSDILGSLDEGRHWATKVGYPVMLKSTAGGGGIGMQICDSEAELVSAWDKVKRLSANYFANDGVFLEKYIRNARHIEVQIFGDGEGKAVAIGERDCSAQRRNQKVLEECPAPNLSDELRHRLHATAEALMASVKYRNAGTVEFIFDADAQDFYFLEVNTRLQVEHGVTEEVWGLDLVAWMIALAAGELGDIVELKSALQPRGHAIQARLYAEDPLQDSRPSAGLLSLVAWPQEEDLRIDHWIETGIEVSALFDPMLAKIIAKGETREAALKNLSTALAETTVYGIETNCDYVKKILDDAEFVAGRFLTRSLARFAYTDSVVRVISGGTMTSVQDYPGRRGLWHVGIPRSGPMDSLNFRIANKLLGNSDDAAGLEITVNGPSLLFLSRTRIALCGAELDATLDGEPMAMYRPITVDAGQTLRLGKIRDGARAYLAIAGGIQCPSYLGSRSTFTLGNFGGHNGRSLRSGDVLHIASVQEASHSGLAFSKLPAITNRVQLRVIYGPHGAPDFFTPADIEEFFSHEWEVHYNSSRTGVRLIGPKPQWARETGGEAGLHPSNIHDNAYAFGSVDFTGDMPVILGPDGPSLGGFVCPVTVITADLWKLGQLRAGSKIHFVPVTVDEANALERERETLLAAAHVSPEDLCKSFADTARENSTFCHSTLANPVVLSTRFQDEDIVVRLAGDHFVLLELGPMELDIARRFRVHALMLHLDSQRVSGMYELTPGIRSLQIHYDPLVLPLNKLLGILESACAALSTQKTLSLPSRVVHIPLSWDDEACRLAIAKYTQSVRPNAPWCPSNLDFIRRINGLDDIDAVKKIVFDAAYLVMGLGDVYLGAPVATPLDPRHRLVTTKYNPARTWTAENSVGIGGAYLCIYGMEGPGGYQFVGRTLQMWNRYRKTAEFDEPWLLRFFDQIRFYEVSQDELQEIRKKFPLGIYPLKIESTEFKLDDYEQFLDQQRDSILEFTAQRQIAFEEELDQWRKNGLLRYEQKEQDDTDQATEELPSDCVAVDSPVSGTLWQALKNVGDKVREGEAIMILESMKMELECTAACAGTLQKVFPKQGQAVSAGQCLAWIKADAEEARE